MALAGTVAILVAATALEGPRGEGRVESLGQVLFIDTEALGAVGALLCVVVLLDAEALRTLGALPRLLVDGTRAQAHGKRGGRRSGRGFGSSSGSGSILGGFGWRDGGRGGGGSGLACGRLGGLVVAVCDFIFLGLSCDRASLATAFWERGEGKRTWLGLGGSTGGLVVFLLQAGNEVGLVSGLGQLLLGQELL